MNNRTYTETEPVTYKAEILGEGVPYVTNCWTGDVEKAEAYEIKDGRTVIEVTLQPGEACMYALNMAEKPAACAAPAKVVSEIDLPKWNLTVESWDAGKRVDVTEDRGLGYVTKEIYYETDVTVMDAGEVELKPWKDIPSIGPEVSGVGTYTTTFDLDCVCGKIEFATAHVTGMTYAVYVNGVKAPAVSIENPVVDITALVKEGANEIKVEIGTTLTNRLTQRGYFDNIPVKMGIINSDPTVVF